MDRKLPFTFNWSPLSQKVLTKRVGRFLVSPRFCTTFNNRFFKWRMVMYPNGLSTDTINRVKEATSEDVQGCVVFLIMTNQSIIKRGLRAFVDARLDILTRDQTSLSDSLINCIFRPNDTMEACKTGDPAAYLVHAFKFHTNMNESSDKLLLLSENRIILRCTLQIQMSDFFQGRIFIPDKPRDMKKKLEIQEKEGNEEQPRPAKRQRTELSQVSFPPISRFDLAHEVAQMTEPTDVVLISKENQEFPCHSSKLDTNDFFQRLFCSNFKEGESRKAHLDDTSSEVLAEFLHFMYKGQLSQAAKDGLVAEGLMLIADKYMVHNLKRLGVLLLIDTLDKTNALHRLSLGHTFRSPQLTESALQMITAHADWIISDPVLKRQLSEEPYLLQLVLTKLGERASSANGFVTVY